MGDVGDYWREHKQYLKSLPPRQRDETVHGDDGEAYLVSQVHLEEFKRWLRNKGYSEVPSKGEWEVLRCKISERKSPVIFYGRKDWFYLSGDYSARKLMREFKEYYWELRAGRI